MIHADSDESREDSGADRPQASHVVSIEPKNGNNPRDSNLSYWFWGTIVLLMGCVLAVHLLAAWQVDRHKADGNGWESSGKQVEAKATQLELMFKKAAEHAEEVKAEIGPLLDEAYAPVYAGIPAYMEFHYSLKGEWLELGSAALGDIGSGLDKYLFDELDRRLEVVAEKLEQEFDERYISALDEGIAGVPGGTSALGPVVAEAVDDAKSRMTQTAGVIVGGAFGGASVKALTKVFAKKLGTNLAAKVAAKTGTKWIVAASGAGTGAAVCSFSGPGAAACAVVGAAITWFGVDLAMVKLDEYVSRDEFERDLRELIDRQKEETRRVLEERLQVREQTAESAQRSAVQAVSLSELKDADRLLACEDASYILERYDSVRDNLQARSPTNLGALRSGLRERAESHLLAPWIEELEAAIADADFHPWINGEVILTIDLPSDLREERKIRAMLTIGPTNLEFDWTESISAGYFEMKARPEEKALLEVSEHIKLELVQDRGLIHRNRSFLAHTEFNLFKALAEGSGTSPKVSISLSMPSETVDGSAPRVTLGLPLAGVPLPERVMPGFCKQ